MCNQLTVTYFFMLRNRRRPCQRYLGKVGVPWKERAQMRHFLFQGQLKVNTGAFALHLTVFLSLKINTRSVNFESGLQGSASTANTKAAIKRVKTSKL